MTEFKLSGTMQIPVPEAKKLIDEYFVVFPRIKGVLSYFEWYGITKGFIKTPAPFFRKRYFPEWKRFRLDLYVEEHLLKIRNDSNLSSIGRKSKNAPIQGGAADCAKLSLVLIRFYINDNKLRDRVKLLLQVHDQNTTSAHESYADTWKVELHNLMLESAKWLVPSGLLGAETTVCDVWTK